MCMLCVYVCMYVCVCSQYTVCVYTTVVVCYVCTGYRVRPDKNIQYWDRDTPGT